MADNYFEQFGFEDEDADPIARDVSGEGPANFFSAFDGEPDAVTTVTKSPPAAAPSEQPFEEVPGVGWVDTVYDKMSRDNVERRRKEKEALDTKRGNSFLEGITDPQQYGELVKGPASGVVQFFGTALKSGAGAQQSSVLSSQKDAQRQLAMFDRIDAGEDITPESGFEMDVMAYKAMGLEQRQAYRQRLIGFAEGPSKRTQERPLFRAGESVTEFSRGILPSAPGYEESTGRMLGEGLGSLFAGLSVAWVAGPTASAGVFSAVGSGEALERAVQFDKAERKAGRTGLSEDQITAAALWGVGPGLTDVAPVEILLGRLKIPKPFQKVFATAIGRLGGQAFFEGFQEGGQQYLQNLIARELYNPEQSLTEGVLPNTGMGAGVGGIAATAKEAGRVLVRSFAGRRGRGGQTQPPTDDDLTIEEIAKAIDNPQQVVRETKGDRLDVAQPPVGAAQPAPETATGEAASAEAAPEAQPSADERLASVGWNINDLPPDVQTETFEQLSPKGKALSYTRTQRDSDVESVQAWQEVLARDEPVEVRDGKPIYQLGFNFQTREAIESGIAQKTARIEAANAALDSGVPSEESLRLFAGPAEAESAALPIAQEDLQAPEQIAQLRAAIEQASPELAGVFDDLVAGQAETGGTGGEIAALREAIAQQAPEFVADFDELVAALPEAARQIGLDVAQPDIVSSGTARQAFSDLLNSRAPRTQWADRLGLTEDELQPLIDEAVDKGWLRRDASGNLRRAAKTARTGNIAPLILADAAPDTLPGSGPVAKTDAASERWGAIKAAVDLSAAKILPDAVRIDYQQNIEIARVMREDQLFAMRELNARFWAWFGDSKIVSDQGEPLVVYRGTGHDEEVMDPRGRIFDDGIYYTTKPDYASGYANAFQEQILPGANVIAAYVRMNNPYFTLTKGEISTGENGQLTAEDIQRLKSEGYDGIVTGITPYEYEQGYRTIQGSGEEIVAFDPEQIKSIYNRGTFDPADPRISYALRGLRGVASKELSDIFDEFNVTTIEELRSRISDLPKDRKELKRLSAEYDRLDYEDFERHYGSDYEGLVGEYPTSPETAAVEKQYFDLLHKYGTEDELHIIEELPHGAKAKLKLAERLHARLSRPVPPVSYALRKTDDDLSAIVGEEDAAVAAEPTPLDQISVTLRGTESETGKPVTVTSTADVLLAQVDGRLSALEELRKCLAA